MERSIKIILSIAAVVATSLPLTARAAQPTSVIAFSVPDEVMGVDDIVPVTIRLTTDGLNLNALDLTMDYSTVGLEIVRVEKATANFPLWPVEPTWDNTRGQLHMTAGRPNGVVAVGATVATAYVRLRASGLWQWHLLEVSRGFINDGLGTPVAFKLQSLDLSVVELAVNGIELSSSSHPSSTSWYAKTAADVNWTVDPDLEYSFTWSNDPSITPNDVPKSTTGQEHKEDLSDGIWWFTIKSYGADKSWSRITRRAFQTDTTAPEAFTIQRLPANTVGGQMVIAWSADDSGSGIASYQLLVNGKMVGPETSPLRVQNNWAGKTLTIRALDGAGNITSASWHDPRQQLTWFEILIGVVIALGVGLASVLLFRTRRKRFS